MTSIRVSGMVHSPVERVWQVATDIAGAPRTMSAITSVEILTDRPFGPGFTWRETRRMFGQSATEQMWVSACEAPSWYEVRADSRGMHYVSRLQCTAVGDGTRVDYMFSGTPVGLLARVMDKVMAMLPSSVVARSLQQDLADLAAACERS